MSSSLQALPENRGVAHIRDRRTHDQGRQSEIAWRARLLDRGDAVREADQPVSAFASASLILAPASISMALTADTIRSAISCRLIYRPSSMNDRRGSDGTRRSIMRGGSAFTGFGVGAGFGGFGAATRSGFGSFATLTDLAASSAPIVRQPSTRQNVLAWRRPVPMLMKPRRSHCLMPKRAAVRAAVRREGGEWDRDTVAAAHHLALNKMQHLPTGWRQRLKSRRLPHLRTIIRHCLPRET